MFFGNIISLKFQIQQKKIKEVMAIKTETGKMFILTV